MANIVDKEAAGIGVGGTHALEIDKRKNHKKLFCYDDIIVVVIADS
jgi:hypothetical protein